MFFQYDFPNKITLYTDKGENQMFTRCGAGRFLGSNLCRRVTGSIRKSSFPLSFGSITAPYAPPPFATRRTLIWIGPKKLRQLIITFCETYRARNIWPNCGKWLIREGGRRGVSNLCRPFAVNASIRLEWQIIN